MESEEDPSLSHQEIADVQRTFQEDDQPKEEF
jgi:hypothetical protein